MKTIVFLLLGVSLPGIHAQDLEFSEIYPVEQSHSYVTFTATYMGYAKVKGNFEDFTCTFRYDPNDLSKLSTTFIVTAASIDTDNEWRDNDLKSDNWLDAETYPLITFVSKKAVPGESGFTLIGDLTIKDVTREVEIQMAPASGILQDMRGDKQVIFSGSHTLDRTNFNVKGERWSQVREGIMGVANEITIEFSMLGKQIQKKNYTNWVRNEERPPGRLYAVYKTGGVDAVLKEFEKMKLEMEVNEFAINTMAYMVLKDGQMDDAIKLFQKNAEEFPDTYNVYNSLGEAYATAGNWEQAKVNFAKSLVMNPDDIHAKEILRHLD